MMTFGCPSSPPKRIVFSFHETILSFGEPGSLGYLVWWFQPIWNIFVKMGISPNFRGETKEICKKLPARAARVCYWKKPAVHLVFTHDPNGDPGSKSWSLCGSKSRNFGWWPEVGFHCWKNFHGTFGGMAFCVPKKRLDNMVFVQFFVWFSKAEQK